MNFTNKKINTMNNYFENSEIFENFDDVMFSNSDGGGGVVGAVATAVGETTKGVGMIASAGATKQASKIEIERLVALQCGKRRPKNKKKQQEYDACSKPIIEQYDLEKKSINQNQQRMAMAQIEQNKKSSQRNLYIGIGVLIVLVGVAVYFKQKS
jgi:hypothetical protein